MNWDFLRDLMQRSHATRSSRRHERRFAHRWTRFGEAAEVLEDRCLLSTLIVDDDGGGDYVTIQAAIDAAVAGDTILINGGADRIHTEQGITVNKDLTIEGDATGTQVIVQAAAMPGVATDRVFFVTEGVTAAMTNLTVRHGNNAIFSTSDDFGGGVLNQGTLAITGCVISDNACDFLSLVGSAGRGGGIHNTGVLSITDSMISNNHSSYSGGGICNLGELTLSNSTIAQNTSEGSYFFVLHTYFASAPRGVGGGIDNAGNLTVINSTISQNTTLVRGGGIANSGQLHISNSTVTLNEALGGVYKSGYYLNPSISFGPGEGGGISGSVARLDSTIVAGNVVRIEEDDDVFSPSDLTGPVTAHNSLIGDSQSSGGLIHGIDGNIVGDNGVGTIEIYTILDPTLRDNGGPTLTHALVPGSPAINSGSNPEKLLYDQRGTGFPRTLRRTTDIGAVESPFIPGDIPTVAFGSGGGMEAEVRVLDSTLDEVFRLFPYPGFTGGVRVALGDVTGDGVTDVITAAGKGGGPHVKVFDGRTAQEIVSFFAYGSLFTGGVFVATADLDNDGRADIITGAGEGGGPHVRAWSSADGSPLFDFFAYGALFTGGVRVAAGDINDDGRPDIITGAGPGGGPHVRVFDGTRPDLAAMDINIPGPWGSFFAYDASYTGGVFVAANNSDTPNAPLIVTGSSQNILAGASVGIFNSPQQGNAEFQLPNYQGVRVAVLDYDRDGINDYLTATGPGISGQMFLFSGASNHPILPIGEILASDFPFGEFYQGGIFVAGTTLNLDLF